MLLTYDDIYFCDLIFYNLFRLHSPVRFIVTCTYAYSKSIIHSTHTMEIAGA